MWANRYIEGGFMVKLPDITGQPSNVLSTIGTNRGVRSRLCDCAKKSKINI